VDDLASWASFRLAYLGKRHIFVRYRRGHISISDAKDVPLLLTIRNARAITYDQIIADSVAGGTSTTNWSAGTWHKITLSTNCTFTFTAPTGIANLTLYLTQGTGGQTATWPATVKWTGGAAPTLSTGAGQTDIISFKWDGTNYWGVLSPNFA